MLIDLYVGNHDKVLMVMKILMLIIISYDDNNEKWMKTLYGKFRKSGQRPKFLQLWKLCTSLAINHLDIMIILLHSWYN